ncbi:MAG TPA: hypothetical protein DCS21_12915, partial [Gammaproteobacteria bacterium]|nr:hypothetical protein [Gammaproteobacteria bacterium]
MPTLAYNTRSSGSIHQQGDFCMNYQFEVLNKTVGYDGFFRMEKYRLRHELFQSGWSPDITRECLERGHAV